MLNVTARQDLMNKIVETLNVVVEDARFEFKEDKMQATVVDASHVAMIDMKVDAAAFATWELEETDLALELRKVCWLCRHLLLLALISFIHQAGLHISARNS